MFFPTLNTNNNLDEESTSTSHATSPPYPPSLPAPILPENAHLKDFWPMDVDDNLNHEHNGTSSSTNTSEPTFSVCHVNANHPNSEGQTTPEQCYTRKYHEKLNGKYLLHLVMLFLKSVKGKVCDKDENDLPPNSPPPPSDSGPQHSPNGWFPYELCTQFELADFLYWHNQMSEGDTNFLLGLINALMASHGEQVPFCNHQDMHNTINTTTLSKAPWKHFTLDYNGPLPNGITLENAPGWMTDDRQA